jgi:tellurite resistance protein TehA-like permease
MMPRVEHARHDDLERLHPAYFAIVMATGILALGAHEHSVPVLPEALFWLNAFFLAVLSAAAIARGILYPSELMADILSHSRSVGFFTVVAAIAVFGIQLVVQMHAVALATAFLVAAGLLLVACTYGILTLLTVKPRKPTIVEGLNGGWLVSIVATQAVSRLSVMVAPAGATADGTHALVFVALVLWLGGGALYLWIMTLIFFRYTFLPMQPTDLTPPYWINMGAVAISALAGTTLIEHAALSPIVSDMLPFIKGFTLFFWSIGSWWIPMLLFLGIWRHVLRGVPLKYDPLYWGAVFPLGMYSVSTYHLASVLDVRFLLPLSTLFLGIAAIAWTLTFAGLLDSLLSRLRLRLPVDAKLEDRGGGAGQEHNVTVTGADAAGLGAATPMEGRRAPTIEG